MLEVPAVQCGAMSFGVQGAKLQEEQVRVLQKRHSEAQLNLAYLGLALSRILGRGNKGASRIMASQQYTKDETNYLHQSCTPHQSHVPQLGQICCSLFCPQSPHDGV